MRNFINSMFFFSKKIFIDLFLSVIESKNPFNLALMTNILTFSKKVSISNKNGNFWKCKIDWLCKSGGGGGRGGAITEKSLISFIDIWSLSDAQFPRFGGYIMHSPPSPITVKHTIMGVISDLRKPHSVFYSFFRF